jgi:hypothetical protein
MSDRELREIVKEVIADIDSGRLRVPRPRFRRLRALLGPPVFAAALGTAAMGCGRAVGISGGDGGVGPDSSVQPDATVEMYDAEAEPDAEVPQLDSGLVLMYGQPFPEFTDADVEDADQPDGPDGGVIDMYGVPFFDDEDDY